jgi:DNA polymerase III subunit gamma/tau
MGQALYRKYRSKSLDEIVGQEHITSALANAISSGNISHAYLLTGPKGVGKTSIARIIAHQVNNFEYDESVNYMDIIEIDAASNRKIDEIRDLRDKISNAPTTGKYKVYIIDEVHMLTKEAFNALLKTLEEPPSHVIFILATTEVHKLPETIVSRTQKYTFKPHSLSDMKTHLKLIAGHESIKISDEAIELIGKHADGSFRDAISLLDQARHIADEVDADSINMLVGTPPAESIANLIDIVSSQKKPSELVKQLNALRAQGYVSSKIASELNKQIRTLLISEEDNIEPRTAFELATKLMTVAASHDPDAQLDLILIDTLLKREVQPEINKFVENTHNRKLPEQSEKSKPAEVTEQVIKQTEDRVVEKLEPAKTKNPTQDNPSAQDHFDWDGFLRNVKKTNPSIFGTLKIAKPSFIDGGLNLEFKHKFHKKQMDLQKNQSVIIEVLKETTGKTYKLTTSISDNPVTPDLETSSKNDQVEPDKDPLKHIFETFEGSEIL